MFEIPVAIRHATNSLLDLPNELQLNVLQRLLVAGGLILSEVDPSSPKVLHSQILATCRDIYHKGKEVLYGPIRLSL